MQYEKYQPESQECFRRTALREKELRKEGRKFEKMYVIIKTSSLTKLRVRLSLEEELD